MMLRGATRQRVADIFVSYTGSDRDWAFWIAKELEAFGHTPHVHEWEIASGDDIYAWMEQRHDAADHVLCVVSDEYLKAPYSTLERNAALWQAAGKRPGFALFVTVKPSKLPTLADHIRRCELFGIPEDAARLRFREFMQKREALSDFGILLCVQCHLAQARTVAERALAIKEKTLGPDHWMTATSLNNLAVVLTSQGELAAARPLRERSLAIFEKTLGPEHFRTANNLNNLGALMLAQGDVEAARPLLERALAVREKILGPAHPQTAWSLNSLGNLLRTSGDLSGARALFERAVAIDEKALGSEHPETAISLNNLGRVLTKAGETSEAAALLQRAIAIGDKVLGPDHATTQHYKCNYARLLLDTGHASEAHTLAAAALAIHAEANSARNNWTKESARVSADALDALGRGDEATAVREKYGIEGKKAAKEM
jgi:tetratricopeptide (TPR) repeat protein